MPTMTLATGVTVKVSTPTPVIKVAPPAGPRVLALPVRGPEGPAGAGALELQAHIDSPTPHPAYDVDMPSLTLLFNNGLV